MFFHLIWLDLLLAIERTQKSVVHPPFFFELAVPLNVLISEARAIKGTITFVLEASPQYSVAASHGFPVQAQVLVSSEKSMTCSPV